MTDYRDSNLFKDMLGTVTAVREWDPRTTLPFSHFANYPNILVCGEGSSRIFPAKALINRLNRNGNFRVHTTGAWEAAGFALTNETAVLLLSNSGQTAETVRLAEKLTERNITWGSVTAVSRSPLEALSPLHHTLENAEERAVAATKSVVLQSFFLDSLLDPSGPEQRKSLSAGIESILHSEIHRKIIEKLAESKKIYFSGPNNGAAEELALKCVEILHKPGIFLEGTLPLHGYEEVMNPFDSLIMLDPPAVYDEKIRKHLAEDAGINILTISTRQTPFATLRYSAPEQFAPYCQLATGWRLLAETGAVSGVDIDRPLRARKVGNPVSHQGETVDRDSI